MPGRYGTSGGATFSISGIEPTEKTCRACGASKPPEDFELSVRRAVCRACVNASRVRRNKAPEIRKTRREYVRSALGKLARSRYDWRVQLNRPGTPPGRKQVLRELIRAANVESKRIKDAGRPASKEGQG